MAKAVNISDYASAVAYLDGARGVNRGQYRRLAPNRYVAWLDDDTVGVILHHTVIVAYHADGRATLDTGGWNTVTTKKWLGAHAPPARVWSESCQLFVRLSCPELTPARVWKCRTCKGAGAVPSECYGPGWCYGAWDDRTCEHGERSNHRRDTCEHGQTARHATGDRDCWRCEGAGRRDYGSRPIHYKWNGGPLLVSADGEPIGPTSGYHAPGKPYKATVHKYVSAPSYAPSYAPPVPSVSGDAVLGSLGELLPGLGSPVRYPCACADDDTVAVSTIIVHLNDTHRWTRETIADWLDTLDIDLGFPVTP